MQNRESGKHIYIHIGLNPNMVFFVLSALLLSGLPLSLDSEQLTLTTYYPSPTGNYVTLRSQDNTYLAIADAGKVGIGTDTPDASYKVDIKGGGLRVEGGVTIAPKNAGDVNSITVTGNINFVDSGRHRYIHFPGGCSLVALPTKDGDPAANCGGGYITMVPGIYMEGPWYLPAHTQPTLDGRRMDDFEIRSRKKSDPSDPAKLEAWRGFAWFHAGGSAYCCPK